jgi:hypothetical protein
MPLTLALSRGFAWSDSSNGEPNTVILTVTNSGATALVVSSLQVTEASATGASITQPLYLIPNVPVGLGNPVIVAGGSASYPIECVFQVPGYSGPSPQAPGGAGGVQGPPTNSVVTLRAQCLSSDGVVTSVTQPFPVLSTVAPFPVAQGGALQLSSGFNLVNFLTSFA